jgi:hypothetical protein
MSIGYTAVEQFNPTSSGSWNKYIEWSGLTHLKELISLDGVLCPNFIKELSIEDWSYNLPEEGMLYYFHSLDYLLKRINHSKEYHILAVTKNPAIPFPHGFDDANFEFIGYDLIEENGEISALTNCGGFDNTFHKEDLSEYGLITDFSKAVEIKRLLRENNPEERHAICDLWAIWKRR